MNNIQTSIVQKCTKCVQAWKKENKNEPIDIDYDDYMNYCYNYGGSELADLIDELLCDSSDENQQEFYEAVSFACEYENRGVRHAVGQRLRHLRISQRYSQQQLADLTGITKANISNIERGTFSVGLDVLYKICTALGAKIEIPLVSDNL